ncbi:MAG: helix-turn-helix transcriptional regulator [Clostridia bacterium]|nr:helix-turn-helix transcriptional regulator [Clostridia bacterium]
MNDRLVLDIEDIQIIVHKTEDANFIFNNPKRLFDGFVMITSGVGYAINADDKKYNISAGDIIFANKNDKYSIAFEGVGSYVASGLTLNADKKILPFIHRCTEGQYKKIKDICKKWQSRSWDSYAACRIGLMDFYLEIIQDCTKKKPDDDYVSKAISYIHKNFKSNFSGNEIAKYCSVSISYLRSRFLNQTGQTIGRYRDSLRIAAAKEMLESGYFTITEIASELGYCDVYHFSKSFTNQVGFSPTKWLNNI